MTLRQMGSPRAGGPAPLIASAAILLFGCLRASAQERALPAAEVQAVLAACAEHYESAPPRRFDFATTYAMEGNAGPDGGEPNPVRIRIVETGSLLVSGAKFASVLDARRENESGSLELLYNEQLVCDGVRRLMARCEKPERLAAGEGRPQDVQATVSSDLQIAESVRPTSTGIWADGLVVDSDHFSTTLLACADLAGRQLDSKQYEVAGTSPFGRVTVLLEPEAPHRLVKANVAVSQDIIRRGRNPFERYEIEIVPGERIDVAGFEHVAKASRTETFWFPGKQEPMVRTTTHERTALAAHPAELPETFSLRHIPDGTEFIDEKKRAPTHRLFAGKLVPIDANDPMDP